MSMRAWISVSMAITLLSACAANNEKQDLKSIVDDSLVFKQWVRDTLRSIKTSEGLFSSEVFVSDDTTLLDIRKRYSTRIIPSADQENGDLILAIALLKDERLLPENTFLLNLNVTHTYTSSPTTNKYDHIFEINKFEVVTDKQIINLNYVKGNLIEKQIKKRT